MLQRAFQTNFETHLVSEYLAFDHSFACYRRSTSYYIEIRSLFGYEIAFWITNDG